MNKLNYLKLLFNFFFWTKRLLFKVDIKLLRIGININTKGPCMGQKATYSKLMIFQNIFNSILKIMSFLVLFSCLCMHGVDHIKKFTIIFF